MSSNMNFFLPLMRVSVRHYGFQSIVINVKNNVKALLKMTHFSQAFTLRLLTPFFLHPKSCTK